MNVVDRLGSLFGKTPPGTDVAIGQGTRLDVRNKLAPSTNGQEKVHGATGVSFLGSPDWRTVIRLDSVIDPDAEELTRGIALATSAYAYTAIMYRAGRISEPPLDVVEPGEDGDVEVGSHELAMMLDEPSLDFDMGELQQLTEIYRCVTGAALWVKEIDVADRPARWIPFSGDEFATGSAEGRIYGKFRVETADGPRDYTADEVVHFRDVNPTSWRKGLSKLDVALALLDLGHQVNRTVRNYLRKAMFPGGIISPDADWNPSPEEWEAWKQQIIAWHRGPANAGEPLVVQGGTEFSKAAIGLVDLLPGELLDRIEATVGSVFGIPPVVLGWKVGLENSPWSNMQNARQMTYEETIEPRWRDIEKKMTRQLLAEDERQAGRRIRFDTSNVRAFTADDKTRSEIAVLMRQEWTRNERRVYSGVDPLPEDDPRGDEIDDGGMEALFEGLGIGIVTGGQEEKRLSVTDAKGLEWLLFDVGTKAAERTWSREVFRALTSIKARILAILDDSLEAKQEEPDPDSVIVFLATLGEYIRDEAEPLLAATTLPLVISTGETGLRRAAAQVSLNFAVLEPGLLEFAAEESAFLGKVMGETTGSFVAETVQKVLNEGGLIRDIRKAIEKGDAFNRKRAQLVARTETTRAWNGAQRRGLSKWEEDQAEGVVVLKQWLDSRDGRVRPAHREAGKQDPIPINDTFSVGGKNLQGPSEPNCRCTTIYSIQDPNEVAT